MACESSSSPRSLASSDNDPLGRHSPTRDGADDVDAGRERRRVEVQGKHPGRGEYVVYLYDGTQLKLSRSYRDRLQGLLGTAAG
jgi:hypothetical protein